MYQLTEGAYIMRTADNACIPVDIGNKDYVEYLAWVAAGNTPAPLPANVPVVPQIVSAFQARAALADAGLLDQVEAMMADTVNTPLVSRLAWQHATEFLRTSPTVATMGAALGLDDAALDNLFVHAATIVA